MAVTLRKTNDVNHNIVSSVTISEDIKVKGSKSVYSIRLETWKTTPGSDSTEVRIVTRDQNGKFHGATNFKQNIMFDFMALLNGNHSNRRAKGKK